MALLTHEIKTMSELAAMLTSSVDKYDKTIARKMFCTAEHYADQVCRCEIMMDERRKLARRELVSHLCGEKTDFDFWKGELK